MYTKSPLERRGFFCYYQVKCHQYWPEGEETLAFGSLDIICTKIRDFSPSYIYREMYVTDSKVSRKFSYVSAIGPILLTQTFYSVLLLSRCEVELWFSCSTLLGPIMVGCHAGTPGVVLHHLEHA